ncbi:MAG: methylmalonyl-CoA mutase family protein [Chitinophagales bacterium]
MQKIKFSDQKPVESQSWLNLVSKDLKGASIEEKIYTNKEGLRIQPLYTGSDVPAVEKNEEGEPDEDILMEEFSVDGDTQLLNWNICEEVTLTENEYLNNLILPVLRRGCNYIHLQTKNWDKFFDEVRKIEFPATFALSVEGDLTEDEIVSTWRERIGFIGDRDRFIHSIEFDPVSFWNQQGKIENENKTYNNLADMFFRLTAHLHDCKILKVDVCAFENKTASQQLAYALSICCEYFYKLNKRDVPLEELIHLITFKFHVGNNYFLEIAKIRALKILWSNLVKAFLPDYDFIPGPYMHAVTSSKDFNTENKHNILIQRTTQTMSAILGGADTISVSTYDENDDMAVRLGTNIQNLLRFESYADNYRNAADGSFYVETITTQLAEKAWEEFKEIESNGGVLNKIIHEV